MSRVLPICAIVATVAIITLTGCDSSSSSAPEVQYSASGTCDGAAGANVVAVSYSTDGGSTRSESVVLPWSVTETFGDAGARVELMVTCVGSGLQSNSITGEIRIDGDLADSDIQANQATVVVTVSADLPG